MTPEDRQIFMALPQDRCMALEIFGEARGEIDEGKIAVCSVVLNREDFGLQHPAWGKHYGGASANEVILNPWQFSSFNANDPNFPKLKAIAQDFDHFCVAIPVLLKCYAFAQAVLTGNIPRNVKAIYYETLRSKGLWNQFVEKLGRDPKIEKIIGAQRFYDEFS